MLSLSLLISGSLGWTVLQEVIHSDYILQAVFTDRRSTEIIEDCQKRGIPLFVGNPRGGKARAFIQELDCEVLCSVNYLFIIEKDLLLWPRRYAINIHGSLLPKYRGRTPHVWAIINGEQVTGITAHLISEGVDEGAILKQLTVPIEAEDTGGSILEKFHQLYPILVFDLLQEISQGELDPRTQDSSKATYFGKRSPEDGGINWNWSRQRIKDWIRAQAHPYPGAFTYCLQQKIYIHKARFDDCGFRQEQHNGLVLEQGPQHLIIKTPNGALRLEQLESDGPIHLPEGVVLKSTPQFISHGTDNTNSGQIHRQETSSFDHCRNVGQSQSIS